MIKCNSGESTRECGQLPAYQTLHGCEVINKNTRHLGNGFVHGHVVRPQFRVGFTNIVGSCTSQRRFHGLCQVDVFAHERHRQDIIPTKVSVGAIQ